MSLRKTSVIVAITLIPAFAFGQTQQQNAAHLKNATIKFHTNDDDKDADTHVTVTVRDSNNVVAATIANDFGHFDDNGDNGPYNLTIRNQSARSELQSGGVTIHIDPNGNDHWKFNFDLDLWFDDGSHLSGEANGVDLDQDRREQSYGLSGLLHPAAGG